MKIGLKEMRRELKEREERWRMEREKLEKGIGELEKKIVRLNRR